MKTFEEAAETQDARPTARACAVERKILESLNRPEQDDAAALPASAKNVIQRLKYAIGLLFWYLRRPAFAYLVALALAYPAYLGFRPRILAPPPHPALVEMPKAPLSPLVMLASPPLELGPVRGGGSQNAVVRLSPVDSAFVLGFSVPTRAGYTYLAEVTHEGGGSVVAQVQLRPNKAGYFNLVFERRLFDPGAYTLSVLESPSQPPGSQRLAVQYGFSVEVEH